MLAARFRAEACGERKTVFARPVLLRCETLALTRLILSVQLRSAIREIYGYHPHGASQPDKSTYHFPGPGQFYVLSQSERPDFQPGFFCQEYSVFFVRKLKFQ